MGEFVEHIGDPADFPRVDQGLFPFFLLGLDLLDEELFLPRQFVPLDLELVLPPFAFLQHLLLLLLEPVDVGAGFLKQLE